MPPLIPDPMFYCPGLANVAGELTLDGEEAHHARNVRRLSVGDRICLFDGCGTVARAIVMATDPQSRGLRLQLHDRQSLPPPRPQIELACALPKGDRQNMLLDMATQLGVTAFRPLLCERSVVKVGANAQQRWRRTCLEACKQSRRAHLPVIHEALTPAEIASLTVDRCTIWVADPRGTPLHAVSVHTLERLLIMVGPEGGFTDAETAHLVESGAQVFALGPAVLRVEVAAIALLAYVALGARNDW
ncbi:MAG: RsmE family RNA methyltransferase [Acidiferrobacterales bacterium]